VKEALNFITLGLLGMLVIAVVGGMFWGAVRGSKRTFIRIGILIIVFIFTLLITPLVSNIIYSAALNKISIDGKTVNEFITESDVIKNATDTIPEAADFIKNVPLVLVNIVVFMLLFFVLRYLSMIIYKIVAARVAPKKGSDDEKTKHSRLMGILTGALQGFLIFAFVFVPINGLMFCLYKVDKYNPKLATINVLDSDVQGDFDLGSINKTIRDANTEIQNSPIGTITRLSGVQFISNIALNPLCTVKAGRTAINVKDDAVNGLELTRDYIAIDKLVNDSTDLTRISEQQYAEIKNIVNKAFNIGLVKFALNINLSEFAKKQDFLSAYDFLPDNEDESSQLVFNEAIYSSLSMINADSLHSDLLNIVDICQMVFADHKLLTSEVSDNVNLYKRVDALFFAINNKMPTESAFTDVNAALTEVKVGDTDLAHQIAKKVSELNIFKNILSDDKTAVIYSIPLSQAAKIDKDDAEITDFEAFWNGIAKIVEHVCSVGPTAANIVENADDINIMLNILIDSNNSDSKIITSIGGILETLTNPGMGTDKITRSFLYNELDKLKGTAEGVLIDAFIDPLMEQLGGTDNIEWTSMLITVSSLISEIKNIQETLSNIDINSIGSLTFIDADLINIALNDPIVTSVVASIIKDYIIETNSDQPSFEEAVNTFLDQQNNEDLSTAVRKLFDFLK